MLWCCCQQSTTATAFAKVGHYFPSTSFNAAVIYPGGTGSGGTAAQINYFPESAFLNDTNLLLLLEAVQIPQGVSLVSSLLHLVDIGAAQGVHTSNDGVLGFDVVAWAIDDALAYGSSPGWLRSHIEALPVTSAVPHLIDVPRAVPSDVPLEIAGVIQEIINRPGWAPGNDILVMLRRNGSSAVDTPPPPTRQVRYQTSDDHSFLVSQW